MKFVALMKLYRGGEWLRLCLDQAKDAIDGVVAVAGRPWVPTAIPENCLDRLRQWRRDNPKTPVRILGTASDNQDEQYRFGMACIRADYGDDAVAMILDTDEIWLDGDAGRLREFVQEHRGLDGVKVRMRTYIKSPLYMVDPPEPHKPSCAIPVKSKARVEARFNRFGDGRWQVLPNIFMHHYSYVREDVKDIALKFATTNSQEVTPPHRDWMETTWDRIPDVQNFHMTVGCERCWHRIITLTPDQIPSSVASLPFIQQMISREKEVVQ